MPSRNSVVGEEVGVEQRRLARALAPHEPAGERPEGEQADRDQDADELAALLPDEDADHDAAHADGRQHRADDVDAARAGVRHVVDQLEADEDDPDHDDLEREADAPRQERGQEAAEQRADGGGDRRGGADQRVGLLLRRALEVAVDQRLHRRQQQRRAEPADDRPEHDDRGEPLRERHRERAQRVAEQPDDERALASDQVADLAPDQDERRRHQRLQRDRALHAAHGRVEVLDDLRDRHVHQRRVDDEHEHRHRQQHGQAAAGGLRLRVVVGSGPPLRGSLGAIVPERAPARQSGATAP